MDLKERILQTAAEVGVRASAALELAPQAFLARADEGPEEVFVRTGRGTVSTLKSALEACVPDEVKAASARDRQTYQHVMERRATRAATPEIPTALPVDPRERLRAVRRWRIANGGAR
jgi:hypothetical protein